RYALAHESVRPGRVGLGAPHVVAIDETDDTIELTFEDVDGRHGAQLTIEHLHAVAEDLGRAQGGPGRKGDPDYIGEEPWLSHGFLAHYSGTRPGDPALLYDDVAW